MPLTPPRFVPPHHHKALLASAFALLLFAGCGVCESGARGSPSSGRKPEAFTRGEITTRSGRRQLHGQQLPAGHIHPPAPPAVPPHLCKGVLGNRKHRRPAAEDSVSWKVKPTTSLLHRLRSLAAMSAMAREAAVRLRVAWTADEDCPVAFEEVFRAPALQMERGTDDCRRWQPLRSPRGVCRFLVQDSTTSKSNRTCFETSHAALTPAASTAWWFRQLRPSQEVSTRVQAATKQLEWWRYTWVAVHVMDPSLQFEVPGSKPKRRRPIRDIAPFSAYMYEMMAAKHRLSRNETAGPMRFLLVGDAGAVRGLEDLAGPAFQGEERLVPWPRKKDAPLTLGKNSREGLMSSAATMFLMLKAELFIYVVHSTFGDVVARTSDSGQETVRIGEFAAADSQAMEAARPPPLR